MTLLNSNTLGGSNGAFGIDDFGSNLGVSDFGNAFLGRDQANPVTPRGTGLTV